MARKRSRTRRRPSDRELQAYVDGQLDERRRAEVVDALKRDAALREAVQGYRSQRSDIHSLYDAALTEPVPESLTRLLRKDRKPRSR